MTLDYASLRDDTAYDLMKNQYGFPMVVRSSREPTIDPNTGAITAAAAPVDITVYGIFRFYSQDEIDGKDILANDIQALIEAKTLTDAGVYPDSSMQLIAQGNTYNIVRNTPTQPGGVAVLFRLQIRK